MTIVTIYFHINVPRARDTGILQSIVTIVTVPAFAAYDVAMPGPSRDLTRDELAAHVCRLAAVVSDHAVPEHAVAAVTGIGVETVRQLLAGFATLK